MMTCSLKSRDHDEKGKYNEADNLLDKLVTMYPYDLLADDALWLRADMMENHFKDIVRAKELYEKNPIRLSR